MAQLLNYAPPPTIWAHSCRVALRSCIPAAAVVIASGTLSTAALRHFQAREGHGWLAGLPNAAHYQLWVESIPSSLSLGLMAAIWLWTIWRCRGGRLAVASATLTLFGILAYLGEFWIVLNSFEAF
jgi:hypothetical protein